MSSIKLIVKRIETFLRQSNCCKKGRFQIFDGRSQNPFVILPSHLQEDGAAAAEFGENWEGISSRSFKRVY